MKYSILFLTSLSILFLTGCGQEQKQKPQKVRTRLVLDLFKAIERKDHKAALNKVARLRQIDKNNIFLAKLEKIENSNIIVLNIQEELDNNNISGAIKICEGAMKKHGRQKELIEVANDLRKLKEIEKHVNKVVKPENAFDLAKHALKLEKISKTYKPASRLKSAISKKVAEAKKLHNLETKRAFYYLTESSEDLQKDSPALSPISKAVIESLNKNDTSPQTNSIKNIKDK